MVLRLKNITFIAVLMLPVFIWSQDPKFQSWIDSSAKYKFVDFITAKNFADSAVALAKDRKDPKMLAVAYNSCGNAFYDNANYKSALEQFDLAEPFARVAKLKGVLAKIINNQALCYERMGQYKKAFEKHFASLAIRQELNDPIEVALCYQNMGATYFYMGDAVSSLNYTKKAIEIAEKTNNYKFLGELYCNLGTGYYTTYKDSLALVSYNKALDYALKAGDKNGQATAYINLCSYFNELNQPKKAKEYVDKAIAIENFDNKEKVIDVFINYAITFGKLNKPDSCLLYFQKAIGQAKKLGFQRKILDTYNMLYSFYLEKEDYKTALEYKTRFHALNDSLASEKNVKTIAEMEAIYKTEKQGKEIELLNAENKIQKESSENKKKLLWISLAGLILAIFAAIAFYRNFVNKKKDNIILQSKNEEIQKQKDLIAEKNKEIVDSITYAKRLQEAILPPVESIRKQLPLSFVLYKPKDIVAGDFYWMHVIDDHQMLIAVADCTGHGVPGAMVSVVCANALNAAVKEFGLAEPAKILDKVNELVEETFGKSASEVRDGMDISLLKIERINDNPGNKLPKGKLIIPKGQSLADVVEANKKYNVEWAGANNPLWYIKEGVWSEIKADKQPVGKFINRKPFTNNNIQLKVNDGLFLISDGFADQFGGESGKKIKNKVLKELLYKNAAKDPQQQKQTLEKEFDSWKGDFEQVDDVCIIGIRF
jgi:serine phosphatase RsbU (regulator of sigma subunit)